MTTLLILAVLLLAIAQFSLPKPLAFLPLVIAGCHLGNLEILPEMTPARLLIVLGLLRAFQAGYFASASKSHLDRWFMVFAFAAIISTLGHKSDQWVPSPFNARVGLVLNVVGSYLYGRIYLPDLDSFKRYAFLIPIVLLPLAIGMSYEQRSRKNVYYALGARNETPVLREERARAQGPFRHSILAGTAGATALPFVYLAWHLQRKKLALWGSVACMAIVLASASSGPLAALAIGLFGIVMWRWRQHVRWVLWAGGAFAAFFVLYSGRGPWYLMASIDLVGGSTGWHRAKLIDQGYQYLSEWWLWGSDYTRHWMATGVSWSPNHVDMTNYYLHLGVIGGLPLMLSLVGILVSGIRLLNRRMHELRNVSNSDEIVLWCAGVSLATHAISFISISYFDQMYVFFYVLLGAVPGLVNSSSLHQHVTAPKMQVAEPVEARPLRFYS